MAKNNDLTPYKMFGVECEEGWNELILPLFDYVEKYNSDKLDSEKIEILQVKEKFGGLRFYTNFVDKTLDEMIRKAESESYLVCEKCGSRENIGYTEGWIKTCCLNCAKELAKQNDHVVFWRQKNANGYNRFSIDPSGSIVQTENKKTN